MKSLRKKLNGFTLIELVIVIAVLGILATISTFGFATIQSDARDSRRNASINLLAEALEKYYDKRGEYPSCSTLTATPATVGTTLGIDATILKAPSAVANNSITCTDITSATTVDTYAYVGDGSSACVSGTSCPAFTLKYKEESTGEIKSLESRRKVSFTSSSPTILAASANGAAAINLSWAGIQGASNYEIQRSTNNAFPVSSTQQQSGITGTSTSIPGLLPVTQYFFRIRALTGVDVYGPWSNIASATTATLTTPTILAGIPHEPEKMYITIEISPVAGADGYVLQQATNAAFTANLVTFDTSTSATMVHYADWGKSYYYRVKAINTVKGIETVYSATKTVTQGRY